MTRLKLSLVALALLLCPALAQAQDWKRQFSRQFASPHSWERRAAVALIDVDDLAGAKALLELLAEQRLAKVDAYVRQGIVERLSQVQSDEVLEFLRTKGLAVKQDRVRAGLIRALAAGQRAEDLERVIAASQDPRSAGVRRAAIQSLVHYKADDAGRQQAIAAVLAAWRQAPAPVSRQGVVCSQALVALTGRDDGLDLRKWLEWSEQEQEASEPEEPVDPRRTRTRTTRTESVALRYTERGEGEIPLLFIPDDNYEIELYQAYFRAIEDVYRVYYLELPTVADFPRAQLQPSPIKDMPYYPVDLLVAAFEQMRQDLQVERFALMTHGYNALIAQRYLSVFPDKVSELIMIGPITGNRSWSRILDLLNARGQATGDQELVHASRSMRVYPNGSHDYEPASDQEDLALQRRKFSYYFGDPSDVEIPALFTRCFKGLDQPESVSPDFELQRQKRSRVPVLVQFGDRSLWTVPSDKKVFQDHYPNAVTKTYQRSAQLPFLEETQAWSEDVHAFFAQVRQGKGK